MTAVDVPALLRAQLGRRGVLELVQLVGSLEQRGAARGTFAALYEAETTRGARGRPRSRLLDRLAQYTDVEPTLSDYWAAALAVTERPAYEHARVGLPFVVDQAVLAMVRERELSRWEQARAVLVDLCDERLDAGGAP